MARFIGGPADGEEREVPPGTKEWTVLEQVGLPVTAFDPPPGGLLPEPVEHRYVLRAAGAYFEYVPEAAA